MVDIDAQEDARLFRARLLILNESNQILEWRIFPILSYMSYNRHGVTRLSFSHSAETLAPNEAETERQ